MTVEEINREQVRLISFALMTWQIEQGCKLLAEAYMNSPAPLVVKAKRRAESARYRKEMILSISKEVYSNIRRSRREGFQRSVDYFNSQEHGKILRSPSKRVEP